MNSRERVRTALRRQQPDRTPFMAFLTPEVHDWLADVYGLQNQDLFVHLGHDVLVHICGMWQREWQDENRLVDTWGIRWHYVEYGTGRYLEILDHPLAQAEDLSNYTYPDPAAEFGRSGIEDLIARYGKTHWIVGGPVGTMFESAWMLRGMQQFLIDMSERPDFAEELIDRGMQYHLEIGRRFVASGVDMIWTGDDFGGQKGMLMSPSMWRHYFKPRYQAFYAELKRMNPEVLLAHHSDGNIEPIIPDLIEIGLDVLQAVQPQAMDPVKLKHLYGDSLSFWGTMDVQHTFPYGTPEDVGSEARARMETIGANGGLILAPSHGIQPDVPRRNLRTFYETLRPERKDLYDRMAPDNGGR